MKRTEVFLQYFSLILLAFFIISLSLFFPEEITYAIIAFFPTILHIFIALIRNRLLVWTFPLIMAIIYYALNLVVPFFASFDIAAVIMLNLIASYVFTSILWAIGFFAKQTSLYSTYFKRKKLSNDQVNDYQNALFDLEKRYKILQDEMNLSKLKLYMKDQELFESEAFHGARKSELAKAKKKEANLLEKIDHLNDKIIDVKRVEQKKKDSRIDKLIEHYKNELYYTKKKFQAAKSNEMNQLANRYSKEIKKLRLELENQKNLREEVNEETINYIKELEKSNSSAQLFRRNLRTIEDKCKVLNFVIGRVFSKRRGCRASVRNRIKIDSSLYNRFSELSYDLNSKNAIALLEIIKEIYSKLKIYKLTISEFNNSLPNKDQFDVSKMVDEFAVNSNIALIDFLESADSDPAKDYYSELLTICANLISYIKSSILK